MKKNLWILFTILVVSISMLTACNSDNTATTPSEEPQEIQEETEAPPEEPEEVDDETQAEKAVSVEAKGTMILSTTTSTEDSGLLAYILPVFTAETGWEVDTIAVGTGAALQMGRDGEADVLLVHARADEETFVDDGYGSARYDVMYNDYIIVGPADGGIDYNEDVENTFKSIAENNLPFVSRGDDSGTHKKELQIWANISIEPEDNNEYVSAGQGMGATLGMAKELNAYTLSDRATWLTYADKGDLGIVCEKSENLLNYYGVIPIDASVSDKVNTEAGQAFADWITSESTQELIATFGVAEFGEPLFTPNAK